MKTKCLILLLAAWTGYSQTGFDVASIRLHQGPLSRIGDFSISGQRVTYGGYSPHLLVMEAYGLKGYQVASSSTKLPGYDDYYEISAIAPGDAPVTRDEARKMLQVLLTDRFKLEFRREPREIAVYEMMVDKTGPMLKPGTGDKPCQVLVGPVQPQDHKYRYKTINCPIDSFVGALQADRPILDKTGLTGKYDIEIFATPDFFLRNSTELNDVSLNDAVKQLGLRMEAKKEQMDVLVVEKVGKPDGN